MTIKKTTLVWYIALSFSETFLSQIVLFLSLPHFFHRCLSDYGGYLYHEPPKAARIVMACAVLHNIASRLRLPLPNDEDDEHLDRHQPARNPRAQPENEAVNGPEGPAYRRARDRWIHRNFP